MRNAERGVRNDLTTLRFAHKENYMNAECRTQNAERPCLNAECRTQNAERISLDEERVKKALAYKTRLFR